ncbi:Ff.00g033470.m01.CDS01 [Fusarium sp. VM40]|nr:Ff.00g033470.m01.CDS01 [Fusarium sp. VM40]
MPKAEDGPEPKGPTVATSANQCLQSFQECLVSASLVNPKELAMIEDQVARFSSWSTSIGVFASGSLSMDHRLRHAPEVQSVVTGLLESLNFQCQECILATILESLEAGEGYVPAEEFPKSLNEIAAEIGRLNKISNTIRRASKDTQALTASKFYIKDDEGNNVEETLLDNFKRHINDRFPNLGETIQERMARTMLLRRKRILYRRHRQDSVYSKAEDTIPAFSIMFPTAKGVASLAQLKSKHPQTSSTVSKPATTTPSQIQSATTLAPDKFKIAASTPSVISASKTIAFGSHESLLFPPAPGHALKKRYDQLKSQRLAEYEQNLNSEKSEANKKSTVQELLANDLQSLGEITCPYCLCTLPAEEAFDENKWQNHVKNDLDAYICVFEDCDQPEVLYNHSDQWLSHLQQHRRFWRCPSHRDLEPFSSGEDYIAHMREVHASKLSDKRLRAMANKNSRKIAKLFPSCPLCDKEESDINARLEDHLAGHLRSLALKSLPSYHENIPNDNEDGNNSIDISRPKSRSTVRDLREDEDYVPQYLFTSQEFWDRWRPPLVQAPWSNFLDQVYEDLDLIVNDTNSFFDTYSFQDLPNNLQNDRIIQHIMQCQEKQREASNDEHSKDRNGVGLENTPAIVETRPRRQLGSFDNWATNEAKATEELPTPTLSPVNPNVQETDGSAISPSVTKLSSFYVSQHSVVAESEISDRRRPLIIDQQPSTILPVGTEPVRNPYTVGYTRLISSAPELFSGNREAARQRRREQDEREEAEFEQRVRLRLQLRIAERNAKIASRPVAPAPPSPDQKSEKSSQNRSQDLVEQPERRDRRARLVAIRKEQEEKEEKKEEERYRKLLRERMQPRRRLTTGRDSQRWPEFSNSDDKPDYNGESSEQKGRPNANADENRYNIEGYTTDPGI